MFAESALSNPDHHKGNSHQDQHDSGRWPPISLLNLDNPNIIWRLVDLGDSWWNPKSGMGSDKPPHEEDLSFDGSQILTFSRCSTWNVLIQQILLGLQVLDQKAFIKVFMTNHLGVNRLRSTWLDYDTTKGLRFFLSRIMLIWGSVQSHEVSHGYPAFP